MKRFREIIGKVPAGLLSGVTLALILWFTLAPHPAGDLEIPLFPGADKVVHGLMFGFLTFVMLLEWMKHRKWQLLQLNLIAIAAFLNAAIGIAIEFIQRAMGLGRTLEILDMLADSAGAFVGAAIWAVVQSLFAVDSDS